MMPGRTDICKLIVVMSGISAAHDAKKIAYTAGMATTLIHRKVNIVFLEAGEAIASHCGPGDIAIVATDHGWWTTFIGRDGGFDSYDRPYGSYKEALWAAKAAAEFGIP